jgi:hypothetical protein
MIKKFPRAEYTGTTRAAQLSRYTSDHIRHLVATGKVEGYKLDQKFWLVHVPSLREYERTR